MISYTGLSDLEINKCVAIAQGFPPENCDMAKKGSSLVGVEWDEDTGLATKVVDYCNNIVDAWPIILAEKISLAHDEADGQWVADMEALFVDGNEWAISGYWDSNPLRAAMISYLQVEDEINVYR